MGIAQHEVTPGQFGEGRRYEQPTKTRAVDPRLTAARHLLNDLATIEEWVGESFLLPDDWPTADYEDIPEAAAMIRSGVRAASPKITLRVPPEKLAEFGSEPFACWVSQGFGIRLFDVDHSLGFVSGGFEGHVTRRETVEEAGKELIEIDLEPIDSSATLVLKFTRDEPKSE